MAGYFSRMFDPPTRLSFFGPEGSLSDGDVADSPPTRRPFGGDVPPFPLASPETKDEIQSDIDQRLSGAGRDLDPAARMAGRIPSIGYILGPALTIVSRLLQDPASRAWASRFLADSVSKDIDSEINRANNAYAQQLFLDRGGMPHR